MSDFEEKIYNDTIEEFFDDYHSYPTSYYVQVIIETIILLFNITILLLIIFCVWEFKKMRIRRNILIMYWSLFTILCNLTNPLMTENVRLIMRKESDSYSTCLTYKQLPLALFGSSLYMFYLSKNFIVTLMNEKKFKMLTSLTALILLFDFVLSASTCFIDNHILFTVNMILYSIVLTILIITYCIYIYNYIKNGVSEEEKLRMTIVGFYLLFNLILIFDSGIVLYQTIFGYLQSFIIYVNLAHPILNAFILTKLDNNFKLCLSNIIICKINYIRATVNYKEGFDDECSLQGKDEIAETQIP